MTEEYVEPLDVRVVDLLRSHAPPLAAPPDAEARMLQRLALSVPALKPPTAGLGSAALAKLLGAGFIGMALGGVGVTLLSKPPPPTERIVYVPAAPSAVISAPSASATTTSVSVDTLPSAVVPPRPAAPASSTDAVAAERALLDEGRNALMRGDASACLAALDRHAARYPHGALAEEREALAVRALVAVGRAPEARDRAARFVAAYPTSLMRPAVEAAIR